MSKTVKVVRATIPLLELNFVHSYEDQTNPNIQQKEEPLTRAVITKRVNTAVREIKGLEVGESYHASVFDTTQGAEIKRLADSKHAETGETQRHFSIHYCVCGFQITLELDDQELADLLTASKQHIDSASDSDLI
jgi:hypothetical protein